jgi:hypothetical protein
MLTVRFRDSPPVPVLTYSKVQVVF